jgi:hypothetical protein
MSRSRFHVTEKLGDKQALTPEGFLVISDVPIARIGMQEYHTTEIGLPGDAKGIVKVARDEAEVFKPEHVSSYHGKPVVNDHPDEDVNPDNWRTLTVGTVMNPRRGTGLQADLLIADMIITDRDAIADVRAGKREVSCGYDADYNEIHPGEGEQVNLIGNHVALVDAGRCGPRCSIGDRKHSQQSTGDAAMRMRTRDGRPSWMDRLMKAKDRLVKAVKSKDEAEIKAAEQEMEDAEAAMPAGEGGDEHTHVHVHHDEGGTIGNSDDPNDAGSAIGAVKMTDEEITGGFKKIGDTLEKLGKTVDAIAAKVGYSGEADAEATEELEGALAEEAPQGTGDKARKARDSVYLGDSLQSAGAVAEILVPGISIPQYERNAAPKKTYDAICGLRRTALELANNTGEGRALIELVHGKRLVLDGMRASDVRTLFNAVGALKKQQNRQGNQGERRLAAHDGGTQGARVTTADIQKMNEEARKKRKAA